jgi:hypothetical protein
MIQVQLTNQESSPVIFGRDKSKLLDKCWYQKSRTLELISTEPVSKIGGSRTVQRLDCTEFFGPESLSLGSFQKAINHEKYIQLDEGEEIIGVYGRIWHDWYGISKLGFIVWKPVYIYY